MASRLLAGRERVRGAPAQPSRRSSASPWFVIAAILVVALSLRGPIVALTPVLPQVQRDLQLSAAWAGLVITIPVLAFAVASPLAIIVLRRSGPEAAIMWALLGTLLGEVVRAAPGAAALATGTVLIGVSIALGNVVLPVVVRRDVPLRQVPLVTGAYTAMMNVGSLLTTLGTAPLAARVGWPLAIMLWSVLTLAGIALWGAHLRRRPAHDSGDAGERPGVATIRRETSPRVWCSPITWVLALAFAAQAFCYYGFTAWLPTYIGDTTGGGASGSGALASVFQAWGIVGSVAVPVALRLLGSRWTVALVAGCWIGMSVGLLLAPDQLAVWLTVGGLAQAGGFVVIFTSVVHASATTNEAAGMSAIVQTVGYVVAAVSGPALGAIHAASGTWGVPLGVLVGMTVLFGALTMAAAILVRRRPA